MLDDVRAYSRDYGGRAASRPQIVPSHHGTGESVLWMPQEPLDPLEEWLEKALWMETSEGEEEGKGRSKRRREQSC